MDFHYLDATDLPSDPNGSMGKLRRELAKVYNSSRTQKSKMKLLLDTMNYTIGMIEAGFERKILTKDQKTAIANQDKIDNIDKPKKVTKPKPESKLSTSPVRGRPKATNRAAKRTKTGTK